MSTAMPAVHGHTTTQQMRELLARTSRTFALAIPLLPEPTQSSVCLAYLLFRVADTLEDAARWTREERMQSLAEFCLLVRAPQPARVERASRGWLSHGAVDHEGDRDLIAALPELFAEVARLDEGSQRIVFAHVLRTAEGMRSVVEGADAEGHVQVQSVAALRHYCYLVAGIVGELLTELFVHDAPQLEAVHAELVAHQAAFGEGLQLVNILKDERKDAAQGRAFLPAQVERREVFALARADLVQARAYVSALERGGAPGGFVAFTRLPERLAEATLERVEKDGPGAKVPRAQVFEMLQQVQALVASDHSARAHSGK